MKYYLYLTTILSIYFCVLLSSPMEDFVKSKVYLKVILVEFTDVKHRNPDYPIELSLPAYTYNDFNNMLFSIESYYSPNMYSPDSAYVFGSLRDYYRVMSNNNFDIMGNILNHDENKDNIPDWILLDKSKSYYDNDNGDQFLKDAKIKAKLTGLNIETDDSTFLIIIYAGNTYRSKSNTLNPEAFFKRHEYIMGERFACGSPYNEERDDPKLGAISHFSHIGIHAHELGHLLGFEEHDGGTNNEYWCLMSKGCLNGPKLEGACPAALNPYVRAKLGWIQIDSIDINSTKSIIYDITNPKVYKIQDNESKCYFLIEFRSFNSQLLIGEGYSKDFNSHIKNLESISGVLVWRKLDGDFVKLIYSGGENCEDGDKHIYPGIYNVNVLTPWSDNRNKKRGYYWVPNTKPSLNCGLEIITIKNDNATIDFYEKDPWLSTPSKPKGVALLNHQKISLKWRENTEPDLNYYRVYKKINNEEYKIYDSCYFSEFIDVYESIDTSSINNRVVHYKITSVDSSLKESTYSQELTATVRDQSTDCYDRENELANKYFLYQNYPNIFNLSTTIKYSVPNVVNTKSLPTHKQATLTIKLTVYDVLGKEVAILVNVKQNPGNYKVNFDASLLSSGIYFYQLTAGNFIQTKKMVLMK